MKTKRTLCILGLLTVFICISSAQSPTLEECAKAYAFIHVVSDEDVMGEARSFTLERAYDYSHVVEGWTIVDLGIKYLPYCITVHAQQSQDFGENDAWSAVSTLGFSTSVRPIGIPYFEEEFGPFTTRFAYSTSTSMFYRVQYTCSSLEYYTEPEILSYCTNTLGYPSSLFE